ncbi:MAG: hypothetical protein K9J06_06750 [Flavobacteriales bacterium]|nr:hypothetical protein [Flavobacteriales bacterium]
MAIQHFYFLGKEFTLREMQVISINAHGLYQRQSAAYLQIELSTFKAHIRTILIKIDDKDCTGRKLLPIALANGLDLKGNFNGQHLFDDYPTGMLWHAPTPQ